MANYNKDRLRNNVPSLVRLTDSMVEDQIPENALVPVGGGSMTYKQFILTPLGITIPKGTEYPDWEDVGYVLQGLESATSWNVGDWAVYANGEWKTPYEEIAIRFGYTEETLMTYAWVCRAIDTSIRNRGASFAHHRLVVKMKPEMQSAWLNYAAATTIKLAEMRKHITIMSGFDDADVVAWLNHATAEGKYLTDYNELAPKPNNNPSNRNSQKAVKAAQDSFNQLKAALSGSRTVDAATFESEVRLLAENLISTWRRLHD